MLLSFTETIITTQLVVHNAHIYTHIPYIIYFGCCHGTYCLQNSHVYAVPHTAVNDLSNTYIFIITQKKSLLKPACIFFVYLIMFCNHTFLNKLAIVVYI